MTPGAEEPALAVDGLVKHFERVRGLLRTRAGTVRAVDGVSFHIAPGETLGVAGESGSGKTTLARCVLRLEPPTAGSVRFLGEDLGALPREELRRRRRHMQMVFQDPFASLDPRLTVGQAVEEPLLIHDLGDARRRRDRVRELLECVGLDEATSRRHPHELSGGQRQRVGIARALATSPRLVVADEPVSALDVSVQAQIVNLLQDLKESLGLTYLVIAHDLSVLRHLSDRVAVMYLGRLAEEGRTEDVFRGPLHPYTRALLAAAPRLGREPGRAPVAGEAPSPASPPPGCRFHPRCPFAVERCRAEEPAWREVGPGHRVACHRAEELP